MKLIRARAASGRRGWLTLALGAVAFAPFLLVFSHSGDRSSGALVLGEADREALRDGLRMVSPSFAGRTAEGEPFIVTADWALPDGPNPTEVRLTGVRAHISLRDGREAEMTAANGAFFPRTERLRLENGVAAQTSDGYRVETAAVTLDAVSKRLTTDGAVEADGPMGAIRADTLEALDGFDRVVIFKGRVRAVIRPEAAAQPRPEAEQE